MSTNREDLLKALFGEESSENTTKNTDKENKKTPVKTLLATEEIDVTYSIINAVGDFVEMMSDEEKQGDLKRLLTLHTKDDYNMFQYFVYHDLMMEVIKNVKAVEQLLKMSEQDIEAMCREHGEPVAEVVVKAMIADILK